MTQLALEGLNGWLQVLHRSWRGRQLPGCHFALHRYYVMAKAAFSEVTNSNFQSWGGWPNVSIDDVNMKCCDDLQMPPIKPHPSRSYRLNERKQRTNTKPTIVPPLPKKCLQECSSGPLNTKSPSRCSTHPRSHHRHNGYNNPGGCRGIRLERKGHRRGKNGM